MVLSHVLFSWLGSIPRLPTIRGTLGYPDGLFCYLFCYLDRARYPAYPLYVWLWGIGMVCFVILDWARYPVNTLCMWLWGIWMYCFVIGFVILIGLNTPFTHYTCDFGVLGWIVMLPVLLSWFGSIPRLPIIHVTLGYWDGWLCYLFCHLDWVRYPVYPLYVGLLGIGVLCFVIWIGPNTPFAYYTWDFGVLRVLCFAYPDWAQYPRLRTMHGTLGY